jgi:acetyl esterase/lipase
LRVPAGQGPHPVVVLIHGGCFKAAYATVRDLAPMGDALKDSGIATWNVEYRRVGQPGGGWPGTYLDVGRAVDHLRALEREHALDLRRVVVVGHSAGGNLAMWAAARARLPVGTTLHMRDPLPVRGVVNLAGPLDLTANIASYQSLCRDTVITALMGGTPVAVLEGDLDHSHQVAYANFNGQPCPSSSHHPRDLLAPLDVRVEAIDESRAGGQGSLTRIEAAEVENGFESLHLKLELVGIEVLDPHGIDRGDRRRIQARAELPGRFLPA